ncbi:MAG: hypothetical protein IPK07_12490 [Deltaproteobacteria bacterium]|nr:hypothetical protein [Deltaproteobacteria bacterium]
MSRRTLIWIGGWVAAVVLIEGAAFIVDRRGPDVDVSGMVTDAYVGEPIRLMGLNVSNRSKRPIELRSVTVEWLGSKRVVTLGRTIAAAQIVAIEGDVAAVLERPAEPGTYPIAITAVDAAYSSPGGAETVPQLSALPLRTTLAVMSDGGPGNGFRDFLAAARVCEPAPAPSAALGRVPEPERDVIAARLRQNDGCTALARSAAHAPTFIAPEPRRYTEPSFDYLRWQNPGHWLVLAGAEAEWRGDLDGAWTSNLESLLLALRMEAATWQHDSTSSIVTIRQAAPPRRELVRLLDGGRAPPPDLVRPYLEAFVPLLAELDRATGPEALAVDVPEAVLRPFRYSPLAPLLSIPLRGMSLHNQTRMVQKRFAHLVRTKALVRRLEEALGGARSSRIAGGDGPRPYEVDP